LANNQPTKGKTHGYKEASALYRPLNATAKSIILSEAKRSIYVWQTTLNDDVFLF
jgi:hypothetical protein